MISSIFDTVAEGDKLAHVKVESDEVDEIAEAGDVGGVGL